MYYWEYATAAHTHYKSLRKIFNACMTSKVFEKDKSSDILYRIYYLCGHVIECAAVYLIYNYFHWSDNPKCQNWNGESEHIHLRFNQNFTEKSHIDFFPIVKNEKETQCLKITHRNFEYSFPANGKTENDFFCVQKHEFQKYIKGIIQVQLPQDVPYFRCSCPADDQYKQAIDLLDNWNPDLRYYYENRQSGHFNRRLSNLMITPTVTPQTIEQLLNICEKIINKLPSGKQII